MDSLDFRDIEAKLTIGSALTRFMQKKNCSRKYNAPGTKDYKATEQSLLSIVVLICMCQEVFTLAIRINTSAHRKSEWIAHETQGLY